MRPPNLRAIPAVAAAVLALAVSGASQGKQGKINELRKAARAAMQSRDLQSAAEAFRELLALKPDDPSATANLGYVLHTMGRIDAALELHERAAKFPSVAAVASYNAASVYAKKDDADRALAWLAKAEEAGYSDADRMAADTDFASLREHPKYRAIYAKIEKRAGPPRYFEFAGVSERKRAHFAYFSSRSMGAHMVVEHGAPAWRDSYDAMIASPKLTGRRWRFGDNYWTTLESNVPFKLAGELMDAGYYYLVLERNRAGEFLVWFLDPAEVRDTRLDPFQADRTTGGIEVALTHARREKIAPKLSIAFAKSGRQFHGQLVVRFGRHELAGDVELLVR